MKAGERWEWRRSGDDDDERDLFWIAAVHVTTAELMYPDGLKTYHTHDYLRGAAVRRRATGHPCPVCKFERDELQECVNKCARKKIDDEIMQAAAALGRACAETQVRIWREAQASVEPHVEKPPRHTVNGVTYGFSDDPKPDAWAMHLAAEARIAEKMQADEQYIDEPARQRPRLPGPAQWSPSALMGGAWNGRAPW